MSWNVLHFYASQNKHMRRFARFGTICTIHKNVKNNHGGVLPCNFNRTLRCGCFLRLLNYANNSKTRKMPDTNGNSGKIIANQSLCTEIRAS